MPPIIAAVATVLQGVFEAAGIGEALEISFQTYVAVATVLVTTGASMLISGVVGMIRGALSSGNPTSSDMIVSSRDANSPWRVVYGFTRISGVVTFIATSGEKNGWLYLVLTICKGPIESIDTMYFDGAAIPVQPSTLYSGADGGCFDGVGTQWGQTSNGLTVHVEYDLGNPDNTNQPFPGLAAEMPGYWTSACKQQGHAKAYVRLLWNQNLFSTGVPNITFDVKGRKVYDPRTGQTAWSDNTALCIRDYLTDQTIGLQAETSEINDASFIAAANVCDEAITLKGTVTSIVPGVNAGDKGTGYKAGDLIGVNGGNGDCAGWVSNVNNSGAVNDINVSDPGSGYATANEVSTFGGSGHGLNVNVTAGSGTETQYTCNGAFTSDQTPGQVLNDMCLAMAGYVAYVQGQFVAIAGGWQTPTVTLSDDDFRAQLQVQTQYSRRDIFNSVHGTYLCEANDWQPSDYPAIVDGAFVEQDGGIPLWKEIDLPFTTSASMAQRIAKIQLERCRRQITLTAHCKLTAAVIQPGDVIMLNHPRFGWSSATFFVTDVSFVSDTDGNNAPSLGVDLILQQTDENIYSWTAGDEIGSINYATALLPDPTQCQAPTNVTATSGESVAAIGADGIIINRILLQWTAPNDQFVVNGGMIVMQWRLTNGGNGQPGPWMAPTTVDGSATAVYISPVSGNTSYDIAVWSVNTYGVQSVIAEVLNVNTDQLVSSFTGEAGTVSSLSNFTQDDLASGATAVQYLGLSSNENIVSNPNGLSGSVGKAAPGWANGTIVDDTLPNGATGPCIRMNATGPFQNLQCNSFSFTPGSTYQYTAYVKTGGKASWFAYGGPNNILQASFGSPTAWTKISYQYTVPISGTNPSTYGWFQFTYFNSGVSDWIEVWGVSVVMVRTLGDQVAEANGQYFAGEHGADITGNHTAADTTLVNGVPSSSVSPIANLMPAEAGADVTSRNTSALTASLSNQNSDDLASGFSTLIPTQTQINNAIDAQGNLLLKNVDSSSPTNSTTTSSSMTPISGVTITITTHGNKVLVLLTGSFWVELGSGTGVVAIYGTNGQLLEAEVGVTEAVPCTLSVIAIPTASTHTFYAQWQAAAGSTLRGDYISIQVVELG